MESTNNKNRVGIINITYELLKNTDLLKEAFTDLGIWVIDVEPNYQVRAKRYILESEHFDELKEGENIPEYNIHAEFNEDKLYQEDFPRYEFSVIKL